MTRSGASGNIRRMSAAATPLSLAELHRLVCNLLRVGHVAQVDLQRALVRVQCGGLLSDWLRWFEHRAASTSTWSAPAIGEQVMLLAPGGDLNAAVALRGIYSDSHPAPSNSGSMHTTQYPDGASVSYDHASGTLTAVGVQTATVQAAGSCTIDTPSTTVTGTLTVQGLLTYQGGLAGSGGNGATMNGPFTQTGGNLSSNGVVLDSHTHSGVQAGGSSTGGPQ